jgi:hypothetical protein
VNVNPSRPHRIASRLIQRFGPQEAYYVAARRVIGRLIGSDTKALQTWQAVRNECYVAMRKVGTAQVWH